MKIASPRSRVICWLSTARYSHPLDPTTSKKWMALAEGLGAELTVIGFSPNILPRFFTEYARFYLLPQPHVSVLRYVVFFCIAPLIAFWLAARHDAQIFIAQSPYEGAVGALVKRIGGLFRKPIRLIVESHNDFAEAVFLQRRIPFPHVYTWVMRKFVHYALRHADALRCISQVTCDQLKQYAPDLPLVRFMAWTDAEVFMNATREMPIDESKHLVYAGVLVPGKGTHHLIDAFAGMDRQDVILDLIGRAPNQAYARELQNQVARLGISDRVKFAGEISQAELARYMSRARVLVLPSLSEGLGRVVIEAMMCGTPVIASKVGGLAEIVVDGENGLLVPPGDVAALTHALDQIMALSTITEMSCRAKQFATQFFSMHSYVEGHRRLFALVESDPHENARSAFTDV